MYEALLIPHNVFKGSALNDSQSTRAQREADFSVMEPSSLGRATGGVLVEDYERAEEGRRLFCPQCLLRTRMFRRSGDRSRVGHFAHYPGQGHDCPLHSDNTGNSWGPGGGVPPIPPSHLEILGARLRRALQLNRAERAVLRYLPADDPPPRTLVDGLSEAGSEIMSLAWGDHKLWVPPFDGRRDARETLFFVPEGELERLPASLLQLLFAVRPGVVLREVDEETAEMHFALLSWSGAPDRGAWLPLEDVDMFLADYETLLGIGRPPEVLFVRATYRPTIEHLVELLRREVEGSVEHRLLRLVAKRLLVEGAGVHSTVFEESRDVARTAVAHGAVFPSEDRLLTTSEAVGLLARADAPWESVGDDRLLRDTIDDVLRGVVVEGDRRLESALATIDELKAELDEVSGRFASLDADATAQRQAQADEFARLKEKHADALAHLEEKHAAEIADRDAKLAEARKRATSHRRALTKREGELEEARGELETLRTELETAHGRHEDIRAELAVVDRDAQDQADALRETIADLRSELRRERKRSAAVSAEIAEMRSHFFGRLAANHYLDDGGKHFA